MPVPLGVKSILPLGLVDSMVVPLNANEPTSNPPEPVTTTTPLPFAVKLISPSESVDSIVLPVNSKLPVAIEVTADNVPGAMNVDGILNVTTVPTVVAVISFAVPSTAVTVPPLPVALIVIVPAPGVIVTPLPADKLAATGETPVDPINN